MEKDKQMWRRKGWVTCKRGEMVGRLTLSSSSNFSFPLLSLLQLQLPKIGGIPPPLFLPTDPPMVWLLAKCWVRSSEFQLHELQSHLLRGHLMAEVFAVATMRCLPSVHPVFKVIPYSQLDSLACFSFHLTAHSHLWRGPCVTSQGFVRTSQWKTREQGSGRGPVLYFQSLLSPPSPKGKILLFLSIKHRYSYIQASD